MPFGLKNIDETYQRAMVALFHDMMHKEIKYRLRFNPAKCTFNVKTRKLLGFVMNERGIEVDPKWYYWTKMELDCYHHVKKCMKCHTYANHINVAPSALHNLTSPWPFSMFILVAINYFTKWVEATSYSTVTCSIVYSLPTHIITDNCTNLNNKMMIELFEQFWIRHHNSTLYRPKMNGVVETVMSHILYTLCGLKMGVVKNV
ncbi:hypothetical protein CR513_43641, partial [Mucuna pruriens]